MFKRAAVCSWIFFGAVTLLAQGGAHFDAASVKVVIPSRRGGAPPRAAGGPGTSDPGRFYDPVDTMLGLLFRAYGVESGQVLGAAVQPRVGADFYEVTATMPADTTKAQFQLMLQNLLVERFHLVAHHETRNFPAYDLAVDNGGLKLKGTASQPDDGAITAGLRATVIRAGVGNISLRAQTIGDLASRLEMALLSAQMVQTQNVNLPRPRVVDKTGLTGKYTFDLEFSPPGPPGFAPAPDSPAADLPDLFTALRTRLGLRLDKTQGVPVDVIVVDSVDKTPTAN